MMNKLLLCIAVLALIIATAGTSRADSLIGETITMQWLYPDASTVVSSENVLVGSSPEVTCNNDAVFCLFGGTYGDNSVFFNIGADDINVQFMNGATVFEGAGEGADFNGFLFSNLEVGGITGVDLTTDISGLDMSRVAFGTDWVSINMADLSVGTNYWDIQLETPTATVPEATVPEPSSFVLLSAGLVALGSGWKSIRLGY